MYGTAYAIWSSAGAAPMPDRRVVVWRSAMLPASETFIRNQADSLSRWQPLYVGATRIDSVLARDTDVIAFPAPKIGLREHRGLPSCSRHTLQACRR